MRRLCLQQCVRGTTGPLICADGGQQSSSLARSGIAPRYSPLASNEWAERPFGDSDLADCIEVERACKNFGYRVHCL